MITKAATRWDKYKTYEKFFYRSEFVWISHLELNAVLGYDNTYTWWLSSCRFIFDQETKRFKRNLKIFFFCTPEGFSCSHVPYLSGIGKISWSAQGKGRLLKQQWCLRSFQDSCVTDSWGRTALAGVWSLGGPCVSVRLFFLIVLSTIGYDVYRPKFRKVSSLQWPVYWV